MQSEIIYYCDNKEVINKLQNISEDRAYYSEDYKAKDSDAILKIQRYFPCKFKTKHVRGHQYKRVHKEKLTIAEQLKIKADRLIGEKVSIPKKMNIQNSSFAVYVNNKFIPNNFAKEIRQHCGKKEATVYTINKYGWSSKTMNSIEWNLQAVFIQRKSYSKRKH